MSRRVWDQRVRWYEWPWLAAQLCGVRWWWVASTVLFLVVVGWNVLLVWVMLR